MKVAIILGTRPEIIKMSPIIRALEKKGLEFFILHTGQHYSYNMDRIFFEQLKITQPKYNLRVGSGTHAEETGKMMIGIEEILLKERPDIVLVQGDTNTTLAGALVSVKIKISLGHVEAGLRSFDRSMPEEINRIVVDHISDLLFAPTEAAKRILLMEGIPDGKIFVTGNTIVDAVYQNLKLAEEVNVPFVYDEYFLVTVHRQENTDNPFRLKNIIEGLKLVKRRFNTPIIFPIHPRTLKKIREFGIDTGELILTEPLDYLSFLKLERDAKLIFTDSGGVQEEACILKVPCVTLRDNTERPETLEIGSNVLAGTNPSEILAKAELMLNKDNNWLNPFGDGKAGKRVVHQILNFMMKVAQME
jgi:UDP-N-acetylglucosamine 2-epimerase (non-hydrolysing)